MYSRLRHSCSILVVRPYCTPEVQYRMKVCSDISVKDCRYVEEPLLPQDPILD